MEQNEVDPKVAMFVAGMIVIVALTYYVVESLKHTEVSHYMIDCQGGKNQVKIPNSPLG